MPAPATRKHRAAAPVAEKQLTGVQLGTALLKLAKRRVHVEVHKTPFAYECSEAIPLVNGELRVRDQGKLQILGPYEGSVPVAVHTDLVNDDGTRQRETRNLLRRGGYVVVGWSREAYVINGRDALERKYESGSVQGRPIYVPRREPRRAVFVTEQLLRRAGAAPAAVAATTGDATDPDCVPAVIRAPWDETERMLVLRGDVLLWDDHRGTYYRVRRAEFEATYMKK